MTGNSDTSSPLTASAAAEKLYGLLSDPSEDSEDREETQMEATPSEVPSESEEEVTPDADNAQVEGDDAPEEVPAQKPETHRVKIDGEEIEVTLDELVKGYSRHSDYTRKTQTLAEQRKAAEAEAASIREQRSQYESLLTQMHEALQGMVPQEPNWEAIQRDYPEQFPSLWARWQQHQQRVQVVAEEKARIQNEKAAEAAKQQQAWVSQERDRLLESIPEWRDEKVRKSDVDRIVSTARALGFTDQEISQVADHRAVRMMRLAALGLEAQQKRAEIRPKVEQIKAAKPGAASLPRSQRVVAQKRALDDLAKSGSIDKAAAAFLTMIPD